ncbi:unnamed protein product [Auanema sp. JU1783]|nr:unnamed protein product [Auanema sp. JU1783]
MKLSILLLACVALVSSYKMVFFTLGMSKSQILLNARVAEALMNAGHDATLVLLEIMEGVDNSQLKLPKGLKVVPVNCSLGLHMKAAEKEQELIFKDTSFFDSEQRASLSKKLEFMLKSCDKLINNDELLSWLENEKFDVAFPHMYDLCTVGLIHKAKIPSWIWLNSGKIMDYVAKIVGAPIIPSYVSPMMMEAHDTLNFKERVKSFFGHALMDIIWPKTVANPETELFRKKFGSDFPDLIEVAKNCSLVFVNSHDVYGLASPTLGKIINIGGIGMDDKAASELPEEFKKIVDKGKGTVIMSFGSVAPAHKMPKEWKHGLLEAFKALPDYQFVVRYMENDLDEILPSNVHFYKWLPQSDLMHHPKVKALITHGGYNSMQEAVAAGKPLAVIPLFGDQPKNSQIAKKHGIAVVLQKSEITKDVVVEKLTTLLTDPSYSTKAALMKQLTKDYPYNPSEQIVQWTEYVAKFKTLEFLEPAGIRLGWIQYHSLDVLLFVSSILLLTLFIIFKVLRGIYNLIRCNKRVSKSKSE